MQLRYYFFLCVHYLSFMNKRLEFRSQVDNYPLFNSFQPITIEKIHYSTLCSHSQMSKFIIHQLCLNLFHNSRYNCIFVNILDMKTQKNYSILLARIQHNLIVEQCTILPQIEKFKSQEWSENQLQIYQECILSFAELKKIINRQCT